MSRIAMTLYILSMTASTAAGSLADATIGDINGFLMSDRKAEVELARSAAPASISEEATVFVLGSKGYEVAEKGTNDFACAVVRSFGSSFGSPDRPNEEFWNAKVRAPICFNPPAVASVWPVIAEKARLAMSGSSTAAIERAINKGFADGVFEVPSSSAMSFMMSRHQYLGDRAKHYRPHVMLYEPYATNDAWGAKTPKDPAFILEGEGGPQAVVVIPVPNWSDESHEH